MHDLGGSTGIASAINNVGEIVGGVAFAAGEHAFLYDGTMHDLGTLPGGIHSRALAINSFGTIVGESYDFQNLPQAFVYDGMMHFLGTLPGDIYRSVQLKV
jgi:probable HAF family extracellular repeat protein